MSYETDIDIQTQTYQKLNSEHLNTRREHQQPLINSIGSLNDDVQGALAKDKDVYHKAKEDYHHEFNILKRMVTHSASEYESQIVLPLKNIYHRRKDLAERVSNLLNEVMLETSPVETRTYWNGSIAVVYNPITGRAEWKSFWHGGIHGVFDPVTGNIEWKQALRRGVYGVFNPRTSMIEWKMDFKHGVHGVYNPSKGIVEWKTAFRSGVGGVYNPLTKEVEWNTRFHGAVVGYFDYEKQCVQWIEQWRHGIALIAWDSQANTYVTTASSGWFGDEDD